MTPRQPRDGFVAVQVLIPALHDAGGDEETRGFLLSGLPFSVSVPSVRPSPAASPPALAISSSRTSSTAARIGKRDALPAAGVVWTTRIDDVLQSDADIVVEAIGGVEPAADWIRAALLAGKSVVTANKQVMARHGASLLTLAARQGRQLRFEAAVGGAMPIVRAIGDGLAGDRITRIVAILNGTTNAVLSRMEATGCSLHDALGDARARGFAEADPSADLDGDDAAREARDSLRAGVRPARGPVADRRPVRRPTITAHDLARARVDGGTIRQIAHAEYDRDDLDADRLGRADRRAARLDLRAARPAPRTPR